jgi:hypothetical protein
MDVVYIVKVAEKNEELRYSLRSLKNLPHDNVHIVGHQPSWVKGVIHNPYDPGVPPLREKHAKWWKSWRMVKELCSFEDISEDFILFNDDFYVMNPVDSVPILHRGEMQAVIDAYKRRKPNNNILGNPYVFAMHETQEYLRFLKKPTLCYEIHTPMVINRRKMLEAMNSIDNISRPGLKHLNKRSLYGNYWEIGGDRTKDVKVDGANPTLDKTSDFLSTSDLSFAKRTIGGYIKSRFTKKCQYEEVTDARSDYNRRGSRGYLRRTV